MDDNRQAWRHVHGEDGPDYHFFRVRLDTVVSPRTGAQGRYVVLDCPDWVKSEIDHAMMISAFYWFERDRS